MMSEDKDKGYVFKPKAEKPEEEKKVEKAPSNKGLVWGREKGTGRLVRVDSVDK